MKPYLKYPLIVVSIIMIAIVVLLSYVSLAFPKVNAAPELTIEITPEKVERGRYLANHVMLCADCHSERDYTLFSGPSKPGTEFVGGDVFDHSMGFPGTFISANITPAGIGDWTDGELFRLITTGVKRDGEPIFPVMPYHNYGLLDREDIEAVIAFLRTLEPVESNHPASEADFPFNFILRTIPKDAELGVRPSPEEKVEYGKYLFTASACGECHTRFEKGEFVGELGAGGREMIFPDGAILRTPNLTPHETGLKHFSRDMFIRRFKLYSDSSYVLPKVAPGEFQTIMPWAMYSGMTEEDLGALYDFLRTLPSIENRVEKYTPATK